MCVGHIARRHAVGAMHGDFGYGHGVSDRLEAELLLRTLVLQPEQVSSLEFMLLLLLLKQEQLLLLLLQAKLLQHEQLPLLQWLHWLGLRLLLLLLML